uniref:Uncharacterized protein LOC114345890 n=1 Tax=Diabrotica virgifera virgifera TaxID=50390 RepID=A0A6P7GSK1_DIAVI
MENRLEKIDKEKIRNKLIITGIQVDLEDEVRLRENIQKMMETELQLKIEVKSAFKIGYKKCIIETKSWEDKQKILQEKGKLKYTRDCREIYIDAALTFKEAKIQKEIRDIAKQQRSKGAKVKIRYQKLEINDKVLKWNARENKLTEIENVPKN